MESLMMDKKEYKALDFEQLNKISSYWFECMAVVEHFQTPSVTLGNDPWSALIQTVMQSLQKGDLEKAEHTALQADQIDENRLQCIAKYLLGIIGLIKNKVDFATLYFEKIIDADPTQHFAYYYLAVCQLRQKAYQSAFDNLLIAKQLHSELPQVDAALSLYYAMFRKHELSQYHANLALRAKVEIGNGLVSLSKFQADYFLRENLTPELYPFNLDFFSRVSQQEATMLLSHLPASEIVYQSGFEPSALTVFISSDSTYLNKYVLTQIFSVLAVKTKKVNFHIHVINPNQAELQKVADLLQGEDVGLRISAETTSSEVNAVYYSSVRFCRFYQYSKDFTAGAISMDADMLYKQCPYLFELTGSITILKIKGDVMWQEISAAVLHIVPTESSLQFLANTSACITKHLTSNQHPGRWFLDQVALINAYLLSNNVTINEFTPAHKFCDLGHFEEGYIWALSNGKDKESKFNDYKKYLDGKINAKLGGNFNKVANGKYGQIIVNTNDQFIGQSLLQRGTWCQHEIDLVSNYVAKGDVVIDAGANYGAFTLPLAKLVGCSGEVYAFEPQRLVYQALCGTLALNSLTNVKAFHSALSDNQQVIKLPAVNYNETNNFGGVSLMNSDKTGESVQCMMIDQLNLASLKLLKADVEGMELFVLQGAKDTISRCKPVLYLENHTSCEHHQALIAFCKELGYQLYWHGSSTDQMMLGLHKDTIWPKPSLEMVQ